MYRRYAISGSMGTATMAATAKTLIQYQSSATIRPYVYDFTFGTVGTPSDSVVTLSVVRANAGAATQGTAAVISALDSIDTGTSGLTAGGTIVAATAEQAASTVLFQVGLNVRATYRWVAAPGGELVLAAGTTTNANLDIRALSPAYTLDATATSYHAE